MENLSTTDIIRRVTSLEEKVQSGALTSEKNFVSLEAERKELIIAINELKSIVQSIDKETAIQAEKQSHLYYQITQLEKTVEGMKGVDTKEIDRKRDLIEKIFMAILGASVTYMYSLLKQK